MREHVQSLIVPITIRSKDGKTFLNGLWPEYTVFTPDVITESECVDFDGRIIRFTLDNAWAKYEVITRSSGNLICVRRDHSKL